MSRLRSFQRDVKEASHREWDNGANVVMPVMPTGAGKTVLMGDEIKEHDCPGVSAAHRTELVSQISLALAKEGIRHDIVAPDSTIRNIVREHIAEFDASFYNPRAMWKVASVDTIIGRKLDDSWLARCGFGAMDEGHHALRDNKWGRAIGMFPRGMRWMLPTATPKRADGKGLGRHADGLVDALVEGPDMGYLIRHRFLTPYRIVAIDPSHLDLSHVETGATGDFKQNQLAEAVKADTRIIGDVVATYMKWAAGKRGITFAVDVEHATDLADAYRKAGIPAQVVTAKTPDVLRMQYMREFRAGTLLQLVNVDLFGEGVDVPACECVSMARPTESYGLYVQQFGRALRLMITEYEAKMWDTFSVQTRIEIIERSVKPVAYIFDHVGNVIRHGGPPDWRTWPWSLDARERSNKATDGIAIRVCLNTDCAQPYERIYPSCPYCGAVPPPPEDRSRPAFVDGDVILYTPELMTELFGAKEAIDNPTPIWHPDPKIRGAHAKRQRENQEAQQHLRSLMAIVMPPTIPIRVAQRRFFQTFGIDTLSAQGLPSREARELADAIERKLRGEP